MGILRFFLAISIFFTHSGSHFYMNGEGFKAVETFFIISGFLISLVYINKYHQRKKGWFLFIANRWLRLAPSFLFVCILIIITIVSLTGSFGGFSALHPIDKLYVFISHISFIGQDFANFMIYDFDSGFKFSSNPNSPEYLKEFSRIVPARYFLIIGPGWSLGIEMLFYIFLAFLVTKRILVILLFLCLSLIVKGALHYYFGAFNDPWTTGLFFGEAMFFLAGSIAYRYYRKFSSTFTRKESLNICIIGLLIYLTFRWTPFFFPSFTDIFFIVNLYSLQSICFLTAPYLFFLSKDSAVDAWIGQLSYPIYITHEFILTWGEKIYGFSWIQSLSITLLLSIFILYFIEKPVGVLRLSLTNKKYSPQFKKWFQRSSFIILAILSIFFLYPTITNDKNSEFKQAQSTNNTDMISKVVGDWYILGAPNQICKIIQENDELIIANEKGNISKGSTTVDAIIAHSWKISGRLSSDHHSILWNDGSVWVRSNSNPINH